MWVVQKLQQALKTLKGRRIAVLGLAFKPGTDDLRDAPSATVIHQLLQREARVVAYDPVAMDRARSWWADLDVRYASSVERALDRADAALIVTEWPLFTNIDWAEVRDVMAQPIVIDARNMLDPAVMERFGYHYIGIGR
jgi:UDPglucose 6-dehydrogenase